jgi:hypothetical protein
MPRVSPFAIYALSLQQVTLVMLGFNKIGMNHPKVPAFVLPSPTLFLRGRVNDSRLSYVRSQLRPASIVVIIATLAFLGGCGGLGGNSNAPNTATVSVANSTLNFGTVAVGSSPTLSDSISNNTASSVTVSSISGLGSGFQITGLTLPLVIAAGQTAAFTVRFQPAAPGTPSVTVSFEDPNAQTIVSLSVSANAVTAGALSLNPAQLNFGNLAVGNSQPASVTLSNSGGSDLSLNQATLSGAGFTLSNINLPLTLHPGDQASLVVTFAPPASDNFSGSVTFATTSNQVAGSALLSFSGTGTAVTQGALSPNPTSLSFGAVPVGNSSSLSETLTNSGGAAVTISKTNLTRSAFSISGLTLPLTLGAGASVTFTATFAPVESGNASDTLSVVSDAANSPLAIPLSGTGTSTGQLTVSPATLAFGDVAVGSSSSLNGSLTASGASVTVASASLNNSEFVLSGISLPVTIPAGQSVAYTVTFTPQSSGGTTASLSFSSDASNSPAVQSLKGTGTAVTQHTVELNWSPSSDTAGYNIYRASVSGGPYVQINASLSSGTTYTDDTVTSGQTYYYVTTAVNAEGNESAYSNQAQAVIPNP